MGELRIVGRSPTLMGGDAVEGEIRLKWRQNNHEEIARVKKTFDEYLRRGWLAVGEAAGKKTQIFKFDPELEKIVLAPLMMGG